MTKIIPQPATIAESRTALLEMTEADSKNQTIDKLDTLARKLGVRNSVIERASFIYKSAQADGLIKGRSTSALMAASLYAACRDTGTQKTLKDMLAVSDVPRKELARCYRLLFQELDLNPKIVDPSTCISRIATRVGLPERVQTRALDILKSCNEAHASGGKVPMGLAATALYIGCLMENENKNQKAIADAAGVTEVTIRNRYRELKKVLDI